jgi:hypothetical protein
MNIHASHRHTCSPQADMNNRMRLFCLSGRFDITNLGKAVPPRGCGDSIGTQAIWLHDVNFITTPVFNTQKTLLQAGYCYCFSLEWLHYRMEELKPWTVS